VQLYSTTLTEDGPYEYDQYLDLVNRLQTSHNNSIVLYRVKKQYGKHEYLKNIILQNIESLYNFIIIITTTITTYVFWVP
jgi:hypothetical protein